MIALIAIGAWVLSKTKPAAAIAAAPALTSTKVPATTQEVAAQTQQVAKELAAIAQQHPNDPTFAEHAQQAIASSQATLSAGMSLAEDPGAQIYSQQLKAYQQYTLAGGKLDWETLTLYEDWKNWRSLPEFTAEPVPTPEPTPEPEPVVAVPKEISPLAQRAELIRGGMSYADAQRVIMGY